MSGTVLYDAPGPRARVRSRVISVVAIVAAAALVGWLVFSLAQPRESAGGVTLTGYFDPTRWDVLAEPNVWVAVGRGVWGTLSAALLAAVLALVFGFVVSMLRNAASPVVRVPTMVVLEFLRGIPVLLMMLFILLVFGTSAYPAVVGGLTLYNGVIIGEALRAGVNSLPRGQREAGLSIGLSPMRTRLSIEYPQAFRQMLPIIVAQLVVLLKDTSLGYVVAYPEMLRVIASNMSDFYGNRYQFTFFVLTLVLYLAINLSLSFLARWLARRTGRAS